MGQDVVLKLNGGLGTAMGCTGPRYVNFCLLCMVHFNLYIKLPGKKKKAGDHSLMVVVFLVETIYPFVCGAEWRFWRYI